MTGNRIGNQGGMFFASMLKINSTLKKLDLGDCDVVSNPVKLSAIRHKSFKGITRVLQCLIRGKCHLLSLIL